MIIKRPENEDISALKLLWHQAFNDTDEFIDKFFITSFNKNRATVLKINDEVASALYWFDCTFENKPVAYIYAVATFKNFQKQGLCSKMMEETHRHLKEQGYIGTCLVPSNKALFDFYAKLGYTTSIYNTENEVIAEKGNVSFTKISIEEYLQLRKNYLPENIITQNDFNFLKLQAAFYAGDDFLFAARKEKDTLFALEFFGNKNKQGNIIYVKNLKKGIFRAHGTEKPFAMYLPFEETKLPKHLDFAFD